MNINVEEIMKPYFDKKKEIENILELEKQYNKERNLLEIKLQNLRDNKESKIESDLKLLNNSDFYPVYGAAVRKDLEQAYLAREKQIEKSISDLENEFNSKKEQSNKYYNVDIRELADIKSSLRKDVYSAIKKLELALREEKINFDAIMLKLSRANAGEEFKSLYQQSNQQSQKIYNIQSSIKELQENLKLLELTEEEIRVMMRSMSSVEREEYERRSKLNIENAGEISVEEIEEDFEKQEDIEIEEPNVETIEEVETIEAPELEEGTLEQNDVFESIDELLITVCDDVMKCADGLRKVKVNSDEDGYSFTDGNESFSVEDKIIELPNGTYINQDDLKNALDNYSNKSKGRVFKVEGIDKALEVTDKTIRKIKRGLKKCSIIKLLKEKKLGEFDIKRVYGKGPAEKFSKLLEKAKTNIAEGTYVNMDDFIFNLQNVMKNNKPKWLKQFSSKLKEKWDKRKEEVYDEKFEAQYAEEILDGVYKPVDYYEDEDIQVKSR